MTYANNTKVSSSQSRMEIERIIERYGADQFAYAWDEDTALIRFRMRARQIKFVLPMPDRNAAEITHTPMRGISRTSAAAQAAYEQAVKQRWRALALVIKAKLEAVESGIVEFEEEFLAHIVLPDGSRVGDHVRPQIAATYETGEMPKLLTSE